MTKKEKTAQEDTTEQQPSKEDDLPSQLTSNQSPEGLQTIPEFAVYLHVSNRTIYRMIERGQLEAVKVGKGTRITPEAQRKCIEGLPKCEYRNGRLQTVEKGAT